MINLFQKDQTEEDLMFSIQRGQKKEIPVILPKHATAAENFAAEELKTVLEQVFQAETIYLAENSPFAVEYPSHSVSCWRMS